MGLIDTFASRLSSLLERRTELVQRLIVMMTAQLQRFTRGDYASPRSKYSHLESKWGGANTPVSRRDLRACRDLHAPRGSAHDCLLCSVAGKGQTLETPLNTPSFVSDVTIVVSSVLLISVTLKRRRRRRRRRKSFLLIPNWRNLHYFKQNTVPRRTFIFNKRTIRKFKI